MTARSSSTHVRSERARVDLGDVEGHRLQEVAPLDRRVQGEYRIPSGTVVVDHRSVVDTVLLHPPCDVDGALGLVGQHDRQHLTARRRRRVTDQRVRRVAAARLVVGERDVGGGDQVDEAGEAMAQVGGQLLG